MNDPAAVGGALGEALRMGPSAGLHEVHLVGMSAFADAVEDYALYIYIYMYVRVYIYIYIYIYTHTHTHTHIYTHIWRTPSKGHPWAPTAKGSAGREPGTCAGSPHVRKRHFSIPVRNAMRRGVLLSDLPILAAGAPPLPDGGCLGGPGFQATSSRFIKGGCSGKRVQ